MKPCFGLSLTVVLAAVQAAQPPAASTRVSLRDGRWLINDRVTNPGSEAEGLLMNVRMVNATFEDRSKPDFDPEKNADRFIARIGDYAAQGVNAFTLCLQGGMPGYEGAVNSAFEPDGSLRADYMQRVERVIRACDQRGVAVILGLYYQRQSKILRDDEALRAGVVNAARWVRDRGFQNVVLEIANEYPHRGFAHALIRDAEGQASLIRLAKETAPGLLVSASGYGDGKVHAAVAEAADFLLPHWNGTKVEQIAERVAELKRFGKPIVCNEDDKTGALAVAAMHASIQSGAGYGLMLQKHNQTFPFHFDGADDDSVFYAALKQTTTPKTSNIPFENGKFQGRIAYSCDGNNRDRDDLFASAVSIAMFKAFNATDKVVHFDYNSILGEDDPEYLNVHEESVRGAAKRFGLPDAVIFNDSSELERAMNSIRDAVNASSAESPLYFIIAGPMEVPWRGLSAADPAKRKHVYCISHTVWNDLFFWDTSNAQITHHRRELIDLGVQWVQIRNQQGLGTCPEPKHGPCPQEKWALWDWMRDSRSPNVAWLYERLEAMGRPDCSDSGMVYFLLCGNEQPGVEDLNQLLHGKAPPVIPERPAIRLEAENFQFEDYTTPKNRLGAGVSQRMAAQLAAGKATGSIRAVFNELYAPSGQYDIEIRYFGAPEGRCQYTLLIDGDQQGESWTASAGTAGWLTRTVANVAVEAGDEIMIKAQADGKHTGGLDYVQLNKRRDEHGRQ